MMQASKTDSVEDRVSGLPGNVIDRILELLPIDDAATTSILSRKWRYVWASLPYLRLDKHFCKRFVGESQSVFNETVDKILLQHLGNIVLFELDFSELENLSSGIDIDRWMLYVTRNGVKDLYLLSSEQITYKVPSYIFNCLTLTHLELLNCVVQPPLYFLGFQNLVTLVMKKITFVPTTDLCVIDAPLLSDLTLIYCSGTQYLNVVSSKLKSLVVYQHQHDLQLNCFTSCKDMTLLFLLVNNPITEDQDARSTLEKLCFSLPILEVLSLGSFVLELLSAGSVPGWIPCTLNCLRHLSFDVNFAKMSQTCCALELIKSSPNLCKLEIWHAFCNINKAVTKYLDTPACLDQPLSKLEVAVMHRFTGSQAYMLFVKLLFAHSPSLLRMSINSTIAVCSRKERSVMTQLMRFPRASPKAELLYLPNGD